MLMNWVDFFLEMYIFSHILSNFTSSQLPAPACIIGDEHADIIMVINYCLFIIYLTHGHKMLFIALSSMTVSRMPIWIQRKHAKLNFIRLYYTLLNITIQFPILLLASKSNRKTFQTYAKPTGVDSVHWFILVL